MAGFEFGFVCVGEGGTILVRGVGSRRNVHEFIFRAGRMELAGERRGGRVVQLQKGIGVGGGEEGVAGVREWHAKDK